MKFSYRLRILFVCLIYIICLYAPAISENETTAVTLQVSEGAEVLSVSACGDYVATVSKNGNGYYVTVFSEDGSTMSELPHSTEPVSARFIMSNELAIWHADKVEVWNIPSNTMVCAFPMMEGAILDADGRTVWQPETVVKNNEVDVPTTYIAKVVRISADNIQNELTLPEGTTTLLYAEAPYLYYEKEAPEYKQIVCRINVVTREDTELSDWVRGKNTPMGHLSKLFKSEILMPWELTDQMFVAKNAHMIARDGATLLLKTENDLCVVDAKAQTLLLQMPDDGTVLTGAINAEKQYIVLGSASSAAIYHWQGDGVATGMAEAVDLASLAGAFEAQKENLMSVHGITISNDHTQVYAEFQPQALDSKLRSYVACIELTNFFGLLPRGLTDEMRPAAIHTFPIFLTGYMTCVGLSIPYEQIYYMALDVNFLYDSFIFNEPERNEASPMIDTLPHEFMHMLEYRLTETMLPDKSCILSLWDTVVPPEDGDTFTETYEGEWDARNSLDSGAPADEIWFEVSYSRTMPQEDRSTLFACLFSGVHDNGESWDVYPHLLKKGQLLCAMLREAYKSVKEAPAGSVYWERNFDQHPLSSFQLQ